MISLEKTTKNLFYKIRNEKNNDSNNLVFLFFYLMSHFVLSKKLNKNSLSVFVYSFGSKKIDWKNLLKIPEKKTDQKLTKKWLQIGRKIE